MYERQQAIRGVEAGAAPTRAAFDSAQRQVLQETKQAVQQVATEGVRSMAHLGSDIACCVKRALQFMTSCTAFYSPFSHEVTIMDTGALLGFTSSRLFVDVAVFPLPLAMANEYCERWRCAATGLAAAAGTVKALERGDVGAMPKCQDVSSTGLGGCYNSMTAAVPWGKAPGPGGRRR